MARSVKHFSLHRIDGTELRVVSDLDTGVFPVIEAEEGVVRAYAASGPWPHEWVTLLLLQDLAPLVRQLRHTKELPPGGVAALHHRPVVNVYDLADLRGCSVFINQQVMAKEGYGEDALAVQGLLAHEHAHPLAENDTTRASRQVELRLKVAWSSSTPREGPRQSGRRGTALDSQARLRSLLTVLAEKVCLYAPREIFANELTIRRGFDECLLHLDRLTVARAGESIGGRGSLRQALQHKVAAGELTPEGAELLLFIGDLKGYLDLALEVAPFCRAGRNAEARSLEAELEAAVFPHLDPGVRPVYVALREQYVALRPDMSRWELIEWDEGVVTILADALGQRGLELRHEFRPSGDEGGGR